MMKQTLEIYKKDLRIIFTNYAVLITMIALCILPSLYAWINIKASWDPYSSQATSRIKVAVVNNDTGATLNGKEINVGKDVIDGLKENSLLGWQFLSEEEAMKELEEGNIYAAIIIPKDFSSNITSVATNTIKEAQIRYIVNEKLNAIAPKITSKGATGIQTTVSEEFVATVSKIVLEKAKELGIEVEDVVLPKLIEAENKLREIEGRFTDVNELLANTKQGVGEFSAFLEELRVYMPRLQQLVKDLQELANTTQEFAGDMKNGINSIAPTIKQDIGLVNEISNEIYSYVENLESAITTGSEKAPEMVDNLLTKVDGLNELTNSIIKILKAMSKITNNNEIKTVIAQLESAQSTISSIKERLIKLQESLQNGETLDLTTLNNIKTLLTDIQQIASDLYQGFDSKIMESINTIFNQVDSAVSSGGSILVDVENALPNVLSLIEKAQEIVAKGDEGLEQIQEIMPTIQEKVNGITDKISQVNKSQQLKDAIDFIKKDVQKRADFLSNATTIVEETIFPMGNYGSQMTPFYSSLASWVGLTILVSMISVEAEGEYKSYQIYFGKLLTYLSITLIQGLIIALGDLYLLKIYCLRPWLFVVSMLYITIAFTIIVYSLVSVFGNVGKVIAIILMILQVAGSGGTFPVQLTSNFFIALNPYLPFTYAISLLREGIGGIVKSVLTKDIIVLAAFIAGSILISILLKKYINKALEGFVHKFHEGGL